VSAVIESHVNAATQRLSDVSAANPYPQSYEYQPTSESSASATDADPRERSAAEHHEVVVTDRAASGADTDGTCDTVSATMWFDRPEITTSFVNCDASEDEDVDSVNSNYYNVEDSKPCCQCQCQ